MIFLWCCLDLESKACIDNNKNFADQITCADMRICLTLILVFHSGYQYINKKS